MAQRSRERARALILRYVEEPGARALNSLGLSPNAVTIIGFLIVVVSAVFVGLGLLRIGGLIFLVGGAVDLFDGALARLSQRVTSFGALLDSLFDRLGEAALYLGLAIYGLRIDPDSRNLTVYMTILILALASSQGVSYLRARGESLGIDTRGGIMTRPERVVILAVGLLLGGATVPLAMGFIAFFSLWTMLARLVHIWRRLGTG
jgi:CDP-diacylglycerol--glycerol-3-phosphate 3-phosphatidyltransferase